MKNKDMVTIGYFVKIGEHRHGNAVNVDMEKSFDENIKEDKRHESIKETMYDTFDMLAFDATEKTQKIVIGRTEMEMFKVEREMEGEE